MKICRLIVFVCLNLLIGQINAQDFSNKGKDFWIPYPGHIDGTISRMALYISSTENTTGEVQLAGQIIPFTVVANQATSVQISPVTFIMLRQMGLERKKVFMWYLRSQLLFMRMF
jgi:hypothetical protein